MVASLLTDCTRFVRAQGGGAGHGVACLGVWLALSPRTPAPSLVFRRRRFSSHAPLSLPRARPRLALSRPPVRPHGPRGRVLAQPLVGVARACGPAEGVCAPWRSGGGRVARQMRERARCAGEHAAPRGWLLFPSSRPLWRARRQARRPRGRDVQTDRALATLSDTFSSPATNSRPCLPPPARPPCLRRRPPWPPSPPPRHPPPPSSAASPRAAWRPRPWRTARSSTRRAWNGERWRKRISAAQKKHESPRRPRPSVRCAARQGGRPWRRAFT